MPRFSGHRTQAVFKRYNTVEEQGPEGRGEVLNSARASTVSARTGGATGAAPALPASGASGRAQGDAEPSAPVGQDWLRGRASTLNEPHARQHVLVAEAPDFPVRARARQNGWTHSHAERGLLAPSGQTQRQQSHSGRQVQPWKPYDSSVWMSTRTASPSQWRSPDGVSRAFWRRSPTTRPCS